MRRSHYLIILLVAWGLELQRLGEIIDKNGPPSASVAAGVAYLGSYLQSSLNKSLSDHSWWTLAALPLGAARAIGGRLRWRSISWQPCLIATSWMPLIGIWLILFPPNYILYFLSFLLGLVKWPLNLVLRPLGISFTSLLIKSIYPAGLFLIGSSIGGVVGMMLGALFRLVSGDVGFWSRSFSFLWRKGHADVVVRYRKNFWSRQTAHISLQEFAVRFTEVTAERTGYNPNIQYGSGFSSDGTVHHITMYGPGQSYQYTEKTGRSWVDIDGIRSSVTLPWGSCIEIAYNIRRLEKPKARLREIEAAEREATEWRNKALEQAALAVAGMKAEVAMQTLMEQAGVEGDKWGYHRYSTHAETGGMILEALGADRGGRGFAIYDEGKEKWIGKWLGARAHETNNGLDIVVSDPDYRQRHMKERRFSIGQQWPVSERREWADRIRLLGQVAS